MDTSTTYQRATDEKALFVFAHGAGADKNADFMVEVTSKLITRGISVLRFNFPYMDKRIADGKKRPPDRMPVLEECFLQVLMTERSITQSDVPVFIGGKSMGSRVATILAASIVSNDNLIGRINGVICLGYPFHPIGKPEKLRLAPIENCQLPMLILQGERDKLGSEVEINSYSIPRHIEVKILPDGDHDLKPRVKSGYNHQQHMEKCTALIEQFISEQLNGKS